MNKKVVIDKANRIFQQPPDIFSFRKETDRRSILKKLPLIDLGRFNWPNISSSDRQYNESDLKPASKEKLSLLKENLAEWFLNHHKIKINSAKEIFIGSRISSLALKAALTFIDNGDIVFVPDLGLPLYKKVVTTCGGEPVSYFITERNNWQPDFERINSRLGRVARLLFLNSPHNPTGAVMSEKDLENLIWVAARENIIIINDAAFQSISDLNVPSLLSIKGGKKVGVELYSFSYQFGLPQLPFGFAVGHREVINGLDQMNSIMPDFIPEYYVDLALDAIRHFPDENLQNIKKKFQHSGAEALKLLDKLNLEKCSFDATPFLWAKIDRRKPSVSLSNLLYRKYRILTAPGSAFGDNGEGFLRFSLTASPEKYKEAADRIKKRLTLLKTDKER